MGEPRLRGVGPLPIGDGRAVLYPANHMPGASSGDFAPRSRNATVSAQLGCRGVMSRRHDDQGSTVEQHRVLEAGGSGIPCSCAFPCRGLPRWAAC